MAVGFPAKTNFANGNTLPAAALNDLAGTLNLLKYADKWIAWSPTWTNLMVNNGTQYARWTKIGTTVVFALDLKLGSTSAVAANPNFSLPTAAYAATLQTMLISVDLADEGTAHYPGVGYPGSATTLVLMAQSAGGTYVSTGEINATAPFTWTTGDSIRVSGMYEAAS